MNVSKFDVMNTIHLLIIETSQLFFTIFINVDEVKTKHVDFDDARKTMNSEIKSIQDENVNS
jgi:hypothetical protein